MARGAKGKAPGGDRLAKEPASQSSEVSWPVPAALEGVKSRKRPVFKLDKAEGLGTCGTRSALSISINLDSRVLAIGEAGEAVLPILFDSDRTVSTRHASLGVARLGPHLAGLNATPDEHKTAITEALASRPQVVVVEERLHDGGLAWADVFHGMLRSSALRSFRGAITIAAREETFLIREVCTERWSDSQQAMETHQEEITGCRFQIAQDVLAGISPATLLQAASAPSRRRGGKDDGVSASSQELLWEAVSLFEHMFEEDLFEKVQEKGWQVSLLIETGKDDTKHVLGLICYEILGLPRAELHIHRLAVQLNLRGKGYGRILMQWLIAEAARMPQSQCTRISCSAFDNVVPFYEKLGFTVCAPPQLEVLHEGDPQTWMERPNASLLGDGA